MALYTDATKMAAHLGVTFTVEQAAQADVIAEAVTVWIDHRTGRSWQDVDGAIDDEVRPITHQTVWLARPPVTSVTTVEVRPPLGAWSALDAASYQLVDPLAGRLELPGYANGYEARVDYATASLGPPSDLAYAATVLASDLMFTALHPEASGLESLALGQNDISLKYASGAGSGSEHADGASMAVRIVDAYRRVVLA